MSNCNNKNNQANAEEEIKNLLERMGYLLQLLQNYEQAHKNAFKDADPSARANLDERLRATCSKIFSTYQAVELEFIRLVEDTYKTGDMIALDKLLKDVGHTPATKARKGFRTVGTESYEAE